MKRFIFHALFLIGICLGCLFAPNHLLAQRTRTNSHQSKTQLAPHVQRQLQAGAKNLNQRQKAKLGESIWILYLATSGEEPILPNANRFPAPPPPGKKCQNCGDLQAFPANPCSSLQDEYKALTELWAVLDMVRGTLEQLQQVQGDIEFYSGIADYVSTAVTAYTTVTTAGMGGVFSKAALAKAKSMAVDQVQSMAMDALLANIPAPYDQMVQGDLTGAALTSILAEINKKLTETQIRKQQLISKINACMTGYNATLASIKANNEKVIKCRLTNGAYCSD